MSVSVRACMCYAFWPDIDLYYLSNKSKRFKQISFPTLSWSAGLWCMHGLLIVHGWIIASLDFSFWYSCWFSHIWRLCLISLIDVCVMLTQLVMTCEQLWFCDLPCVLVWFLILFLSLYIEYLCINKLILQNFLFSLACFSVETTVQRTSVSYSRLGCLPNK